MLLADGGLVPEPTGGHKPGFGKAGPIALVVILLLFIAMGFLMWSMTKHVKKVPASFENDGDEQSEDGESGDPTDSSEPTSATKESPRS
jgi:hypothetical protein